MLSRYSSGDGSLARFARGQFFAIREQEPRIAWASYPDTYKSGQEADCRSVPNAHLLTAGFRKLYCDEQPNLASEIGPPRTPEVKAYVQFQEWSHGLLVFGLPGTSIGISGDEHKFTRLDGVFLARAGSRQSGEGSRSGWTEDTSRTSDACSAIWYRLVNGRESPLLAMRCTRERLSRPDGSSTAT